MGARMSLPGQPSKETGPLQQERTDHDKWRLRGGFWDRCVGKPRASAVGYCMSRRVSPPAGKAPTAKSTPVAMKERKEAECALPNGMRIQIQGQQYDLLNVVVGNFNEKDDARPLWPAQCIQQKEALLRR